jgi:chemotaxis protein methyltransferase CheR
LKPYEHCRYVALLRTYNPCAGRSACKKGTYWPMETPTLNGNEFQLLRAYIEKQCGIALGEDKAYLVAGRLSGLLAESGAGDFFGLYHKAVADRTLVLRDKIVQAMTTNETLWFRDRYPFDILREVILPEMDRQLRAGLRRKVRIWSAACSTGQEPYSIAMAVLEYGRRHSLLPWQNLEIVATDISSPVLFLALAGRYDQLSISRGLPPEMLARYFTQSGRVWVLSEKIRSLVRFTKFNLQDNPAGLGRFDVVFCRNVGIYFADASRRVLFSRLADALRPAGSLLVGASESVTNYSAEFKMQKYQNAIYYQVV